MTGVAAWVAALVVERRRENLQLIGAIEMLCGEVDEMSTASRRTATP